WLSAVHATHGQTRRMDGVVAPRFRSPVRALRSSLYGGAARSETPPRILVDGERRDRSSGLRDWILGTVVGQTGPRPRGFWGRGPAPSQSRDLQVLSLLRCGRDLPRDAHR